MEPVQTNALLATKTEERHREAREVAITTVLGEVVRKPILTGTTAKKMLETNVIYSIKA